MSGSSFSGGIGIITSTGNYLEYIGDMDSLKGRTVTIYYTGIPVTAYRNIVYFGSAV